VTGEQLRSFLSSVLLQPGKPHKWLRWLQPSLRESAKASPALPRLETK